MASLILGAPPISSRSLNLSARISFSQSQTPGVSLSSSPVSVSIPATLTSPSIPLVYCGRGDKKTAKGKRFNHSFGNASNKKKGRGPPRAPVPPSPPKKDRLDDNEIVKIEIDESLFSEITEDEDDKARCIIDTEAQKKRIRQIIEYQKSLYLSSSSSSSFSSSAASCSSFSSSHKSSSLLELMKGGSTSLRRLFDMEHTSLATHFEEYSGSPIIKPIPLWGSDTDDEIFDPWASIKQIEPTNNPGTDGLSRFGSEGSSMEKEVGFHIRKTRFSNRKLPRTKSFKRLPGFGLWRCRGFRFRLRLRRLRIMICGRKF